jgi:hypothetical protein
MRLRSTLESGALDSSFPLPLDQPFTMADATAAGLARWQVNELVRAQLLAQPIRRVYVSSQVEDSLDLRIACLVLVVPPDCVVVDRHAGWVQGAEMVLAPNEHLHVAPVAMFRPAGAGRLRNPLADSGERSLRPDDIIEIGGLRVTSPIRTAWDLGRVRRTDRAIAGIDAMLRLGVFSLEELVLGVERFRGQRWVTTLRAVAPLGDGRAESPAESVLRLRCVECRLGAMVPQIEVWRNGRLLGRLDLADVDLMAAVEYDGAEWHSSPEQRENDRVRRGLIREEGWLVEAFTKENLFGHHRDIEERLFDLRSRARVRRGLTPY